MLTTIEVQLDEPMPRRFPLNGRRTQLDKIRKSRAIARKGRIVRARSALPIRLSAAGLQCLQQTLAQAAQLLLGVQWFAGDIGEIEDVFGASAEGGDLCVGYGDLAGGEYLGHGG